MKFHYLHNSNNMSNGMILKEFSIVQHENEVLLFPFTFIRVDDLFGINEKFYELEGTIINKDSILEFGLKAGKKIILKNSLLTFE